MDSFINLKTCERCGRLVTDGPCACESTGVGVTVTPNITYIWICPKCGAHCQMAGFCETCGWTAALMVVPNRVPWRCPGCGRFHAPHVDTCPFCQPHTVSPNWPVRPYIGDPAPVYIGDPPWWTITTTSGCGSEAVQIGDPPGSVSHDNISVSMEETKTVFTVS